MHSWLGYIGFFSPLRCDGRRLTPPKFGLNKPLLADHRNYYKVEKWIA
jgi:hypothetical protein